MKRRTDHEALLADVLAEDSPAGFRDALLGKTLQRARRKRQWRQVRRVGSVAGLLCLAGLGVWQSLPRGQRTLEAAKPEVAPAPYLLIVSQPLRVTQWVTTQPLAIDPALPARFPIATIHTYGGGFHEVGDDELLALAAPQTAALIRRGPNEVEFLLLPANTPTELHEN